MTIDAKTAATTAADGDPPVLDVASLCEAFQRSAAADPDAVSLRTADGDVEITWREYEGRVESIACGLATIGVGREPEKTADTFDDDGWLRTGDIGEIDSEGLKIVDRKKELIINTAGKNMSPANIENAIKGECNLVGQPVAVGDMRPYNVALLTLDPEMLRGRSIDDPDVVATVAAGMERANERTGGSSSVRSFPTVAPDIRTATVAALCSDGRSTTHTPRRSAETSPRSPSPG